MKEESGDLPRSLSGADRRLTDATMVKSRVGSRAPCPCAASTVYGPSTDNTHAVHEEDAKAPVMEILLLQVRCGDEHAHRVRHSKIYAD
jgi:hypothetical protein